MPNKSVCFVDDDPEEIRRFRENLNSVFTIGAGTSIPDALEDLQKNGLDKPDLFLLDMYFPSGPLSTQEELHELELARADFLTAQSKFLSVLVRVRQSSRGGFNLVEELKSKNQVMRWGQVPYAFFTRKATLEEGIEALDNGAIRVIKKPDPNTTEKEGRSLSEAYDLAFKNQKTDVARNINDARRRATWWWRHRGDIRGIIIGVVVTILGGVVMHFLKF